MVKIGVNGFGRIGRFVVRRCFQKIKEARCATKTQYMPQIVAINDPFLKTDQMANLYKYDSTHGPYPGEVLVLGNCLKIDGEIIEVSNEKVSEKIPWNKSSARYIVDATGLCKDNAKASNLLHDGAERVLLTYPSNDNIPMFVFGVNHDTYDTKMKIISNASCTTNCLAPLCKVIQDNFQIRYGLMTTIHAITIAQNALDGPGKKNFRIGRGALQNIIPSSTSAAKAIGKILPELAGKVTGIAARVPVVDGSMVDLTVVTETPADYNLVKCKIKEAADGPLKGILGYTDEQIVSSDIIGDSRSSIFDSSAGLALGRDFFKLIAWYDNEWAYSCRVVDMLKYMASRESI